MLRTSVLVAILVQCASAALTLGKRGEARAGVLGAFQAAMRRQLDFFGAYVKGDAAARSRLALPGIDPAVTIREIPAVARSAAPGDRPAASPQGS